MQSSRTPGIAASAVVAVVLAGWIAFDSPDDQLTTAVLADEPITPPTRNTGGEPGDAFLLDFQKGDDVANRYLADYDMNTDWLKIAYRSRNIRFDKNGMTLSLEKTRGKLPFSGSEYQRSGVYGYGRYEAVMRASNASGAVSSFFIYTGEYFGDPHDEIDFEWVGRNTHMLHLTYFSHGQSESANVSLWFDAAKSDHLYAFEWSPDSIRWYVDGVMVHEVNAATARVPIPTTSSRVMANLWAGSGPTADWVGKAKFNRTTARYRCISHVPADTTAAQCSDTFKLPSKR
jgi:endo-1,3-1,4-beta-glycanase ExoK